jgi:hypothetical protein
MTPRKWEDWNEALSYFCFAWFGLEIVPDALRDSLRAARDSDFTPDVVYPVSEYSDDGQVTLLVLDGDDSILVRFEPPSTTVTTYLGALVGGAYSETRDFSQDFDYQVEGTFSHTRLAEPLVLRVRRPRAVAPGSDEDLYLGLGQPQAVEVFERVRGTLRRWATQHEPRPQEQA